VYTDFKILKVKVPVIFSARRDFRHAGMDVTNLCYNSNLE